MSLYGSLPQGSARFDAFMAEKPTTFEASAKAAEDLSGMDAFGATLSDNISRKLIGDDSERIGIAKVSVDQLKSQYPDVADAFSEPQYPVLAQKTAESLRKRRDLEQTIAAGPQDWASKVGRFEHTVWGTLTDPGEAALMALTGMAGRALGLAKGIQGSVAATRFSKYAPIISKAAAGAVEGTVMSVPSQISQGIDANAQGREYTASDFMAGVAENALTMGVMESGIHITKGIFMGARAKLFDQAAQVVVDQARGGIKPNIEPIIKTHVNEMYARGDYQYQPLNQDSRLFGATESPSKDFHSAKDPLIIGDHMGDGVYLTDNAHAANGSAASKLSDAPGSVFEFDPTGLKLADYTQPFPEEMRPGVQAILEKSGVKVDLQSDSAALILEQIRGSKADKALGIMNDIQGVAKASGYDGIVHDGSRVYGGDAPGQQNIVNIFDKEKLKTKSVFAADRAVVPDISKADMQAEFERAQRPDQQADYQPFDQKRLEEAKSVVVDPKLQEKIKLTEEHLADVTKTFDDLQKQGTIPETEVTALDESLQNKARANAEYEKAARQYAACRGG